MRLMVDGRAGQEKPKPLFVVVLAFGKQHQVITVVIVRSMGDKIHFKVARLQIAVNTDVLPLRLARPSQGSK